MTAKKTVAACLRFLSPTGTRAEEIRTFGTTTRELLRLADWLATAGCTHVAMESTGVFWRPVYQILEGSVELLLVTTSVLLQEVRRVRAIDHSLFDARRIGTLGLCRMPKIAAATMTMTMTLPASNDGP